MGITPPLKKQKLPSMKADATEAAQILMSMNTSIESEM